MCAYSGTVREVRWRSEKVVSTVERSWKKVIMLAQSFSTVTSTSNMTKEAQPPTTTANPASNSTVHDAVVVADSVVCCTAVLILVEVLAMSCETDRSRRSVCCARQAVGLPEGTEEPLLLLPLLALLLDVSASTTDPLAALLPLPLLLLRVRRKLNSESLPTLPPLLPPLLPLPRRRRPRRREPGVPPEPALLRPLCLRLRLEKGADGTRCGG